MNWRTEPRTEKQFAAIVNMQDALGIKNEIPETKGACSDLIGELKKTITNNLQVIGKMKAGHFEYDDNSNDYFDPIF